MIKAASLILALSSIAFSSTMSRAQAGQSQFPIQETATEFFGGADFNKDGLDDFVIVDKETGKYRLGYLGTNGIFNWIDCRPSGIKGITGFSVGSVLNPGVPGLVFTSPDANQFSLVEAVNPTSPPKPLIVGFADGLGPSLVVAADIGGDGNTPLDDLAVVSIYNSPDENMWSLLRNTGGTLTKIADGALPGPIARGNRINLKAGGPVLCCGILRGPQESGFAAEDLHTGKPVRILELGGLPQKVEYSVGKLISSETLDFAFYTPGETKIALRTVHPVGEKFEFGKEITCDVGQPVKMVALVHGKMLVTFGEGEKSGVFKVAESGSAESLQTIVPTNYVITAAMEYKSGLALFARPPTGKFSTRYYLYKVAEKQFEPGPFGGLASLADNDNITIPDIHARITKNTQETSEQAMQSYTNTIPGTRVSYAMVPIRGGEFVMGSPESEEDRKADEGPQVKVKISPFWMGKCEVTWNEYELFMYPDEEKRSRATVATDAAGDKLADAVTHPSRPYVEMSFGMGKEGFPAISMTQHAANKYCQWLSAKTGQFYRLPTEAEWEYACRAGTTTRYFFGDDVSKLGEYGWFEMNSDFKYQKVGKKKPNPWGLYDMTGNVVEWVLDQYDPEFYKTEAKSGLVVDPWNKATKPYPHAVRGGSWDDEAKRLRSAARRGSDRSWKMQDPQLPKSIWYFSDAQFVGFRIVRPLKVPSAEEMQKYWSSGVERD